MYPDFETAVLLFLGLGALFGALLTNQCFWEPEEVTIAVLAWVVALLMLAANLAHWNDHASLKAVSLLSAGTIGCGVMSYATTHYTPRSVYAVLLTAVLAVDTLALAAAVVLRWREDRLAEPVWISAVVTACLIVGPRLFGDTVVGGWRRFVHRMKRSRFVI
jgi:hypothetical protein